MRRDVLEVCYVVVVLVMVLGWFLVVWNACEAGVTNERIRVASEAAITDMECEAVEEAVRLAADGRTVRAEIVLRKAGL